VQCIFAANLHALQRQWLRTHKDPETSGRLRERVEKGRQVNGMSRVMINQPQGSRQNRPGDSGRHGQLFVTTGGGHYRMNGEGHVLATEDISHQLGVELTLTHGVLVVIEGHDPEVVNGDRIPAVGRQDLPVFTAVLHVASVVVGANLKAVTTDDDDRGRTVATEHVEGVPLPQQIAQGGNPDLKVRHKIIAAQ